MRDRTHAALQEQMVALQEEYDALQYQISMAQGQIDVAKAKRLELKAKRDELLAEVAADPVVAPQGMRMAAPEEPAPEVAQLEEMLATEPEPLQEPPAKKATKKKPAAGTE